MHWTLKGWLSHHWWHLKRLWCRLRDHHNWEWLSRDGTGRRCKTCGEVAY